MTIIELEISQKAIHNMGLVQVKMNNERRKSEVGNFNMYFTASENIIFLMSRPIGPSVNFDRSFEITSNVPFALLDSPEDPSASPCCGSFSPATSIISDGSTLAR